MDRKTDLTKEKGPDSLRIRPFVAGIAFNGTKIPLEA
jgi:hypothetical protein